MKKTSEIKENDPYENFTIQTKDQQAQPSHDQLTKAQVHFRLVKIYLRQDQLWGPSKGTSCYA